MVVVAMLGACMVGCHGGGHEGVAPVGLTETPVGSSQAGLRGDLNGNGSPDVADAIGILRIVVGLDGANAQADCDADGSAGVGDAIAVLRCVVGLDDWPIGGEDPVLGDEKIGPDGQTLVWVPGGSFMMGNDRQWLPYGDERPVHQVTLDGFWIGKCEVTNAQYAAFLNDAQPDDVSQWYDFWGSGYSGVELVGGVYQAKAQLGAYPVVFVTWNGAVAYCQRYGYTLPTEARWEYAAAGPDARVWPWGDEWDQTRCSNSSNSSETDTPYAVGSFPTGASWCGALDMVGNVAECCADWYAADYYGYSPALDPTGPAQGDYRVVRGGSFLWNQYGCRCAYRSETTPVGVACGFYGFRVARKAGGRAN